MMRFRKSWTDIKNIITLKNLPLQFHDFGEEYYVWASENGDRYGVNIDKTTPRNTNQIDFEDNYKDDANKPIAEDEKSVVNSLAIRDTSDHFSSANDERGFVKKTIIIENDLDQKVDVQLEGSVTSTFTKKFNIGNTLTVDSSKSDYMSCDEYFPYLRVKLNCIIAPTSGNVSVIIAGVRR